MPNNIWLALAESLSVTPLRGMTAMRRLLVLVSQWLSLNLVILSGQTDIAVPAVLAFDIVSLGANIRSYGGC